MPRPAKKVNEKYIEVGYEAKVVFLPKKRIKGRPDVAAAWRRSQGLWANHPIFQGMTTKEVIEWLRGEDCDV